MPPRSVGSGNRTRVRRSRIVGPGPLDDTHRAHVVTGPVARRNRVFEGAAIRRRAQRPGGESNPITCVLQTQLLAGAPGQEESTVNSQQSTGRGAGGFEPVVSRTWLKQRESAHNVLSTVDCRLSTVVSDQRDSNPYLLGHNQPCRNRYTMATVRVGGFEPP